MNKVLLLIILFLPTAVFGGTLSEEVDKYDSSQTVILESNKDYVILENKSALIEAPISPIDYPDPKFNEKFGDDAAKECEKHGWTLHTWFKSDDKFLNTDYLEVLSKHKGKFLCLPQKTKYTQSYYHYLKMHNGYCNPPKEDGSGMAMYCPMFENYLNTLTNALNELGVDIEAENEKSLITQKQKKCETLGFEMGTEKNGECVLKLMELDKQ